MAGNRTYVRCPICNKFGSGELGGYCKLHAEEPDEDDSHISETYVKEYDIGRPFIPGKFGIIKDKCDMVD